MAMLSMAVLLKKMLFEQTVLKKTLFALVFAGGLGLAIAQRPPAAETLLKQAREAAQAALQQYDEGFYTDQPLWREAILKGEKALELAPGDLEITLFLAQTYSYVDWYIRAWKHWLAYLQAGGSFDVDDPSLLGDGVPEEQFAESGTELGYSRYQADDKEGALSYYQQVADILPNDTEALTWLGRILFEEGRVKEALPYWQKLVEIKPDDEGVRYYLGLTQERVAVGVEASDAFQQGLQAYDQENRQEALDHFASALGLNSDFVEAAVWAGRTSLELGQPTQAQGYWRHVLELVPGDHRATYFLGVANAQVRWGVEAANDFFRGQGFYEKGDITAASQQFIAALQANPDYLDAWVWAARTSQESGDLEGAAAYWQGVLQRDPEDERAKYFLTLAQQQLAYGVDAGLAFTDAVEHYQMADFEEAEKLFKKAVEVNPDLVEAWGWLGRIHFDQADYPQAAQYFERALELAPDNEDYQFFAEEARRLAEE